MRNYKLTVTLEQGQEDFFISQSRDKILIGNIPSNTKNTKNKQGI